MEAFFVDHLLYVLILLTIVNVLTLPGKIIWDLVQAKRRKKQLERTLQASEARITTLLKQLDDNRTAFAESAKKIRSLAKE